MTDVPKKNALQAAVRYHDHCINGERLSEREADDALSRLDDLAPHSYITDLLYSAERSRTDEEAIEKALLRERLWHERGDAALSEHLTSQLTKALDGQNLNERQRSYCEKMLRHVWGEPQ